MKELFTIIVIAFKLLLMWMESRSEKDKEKKQKRQEAMSAILQGIKDKNPSAITSGLNEWHRLSV